jgi:O-antigen ligase
MLTRPFFIALVCYLLNLGATFNGVFLPDVAAMTLPLMAVLLILWLLARWRSRWKWYQPPLYAALFVWSAAIALSLLSNAGDWRRILIGVWYAGVYLLVWYILSDALANNAIKRTTLIDSLLVAGVILLIVGYWQLFNVITNGWRYPGLFGLPRPTSIVGNPNSLAAILVVMIGFAAGRWLSVSSHLWRLILAVYLIATLLLMVLTYSRGGWIGAAAALAVVFGLWMLQRGLRSYQQIRRAFVRQRPLIRAAVAGAATVILLAGMMAGVILMNSFNETGRSAELRTYIWETALTLFREKPITGHGLFTFGKGLERLNSSPPVTPHSHAHNLPLNVLAELGLVGGVALILSVALAFHAIRLNWKASGDRERAILIPGIAGAVGFGGHHLFDMPMVMPAIALTGLLALMAAVSPAHPEPMRWAWRRIGHGVALAGMGIVLIAAGWWSSRVYADYVRIVFLEGGDYADTAQRMQPVLQADPEMAIYHWQQAILYGLAAAENDQYASLSEAAFERFVQREPQNAMAWANIAALRWQQGEIALEAFEHALTLAPESWQLALVVGQRAEQAQDTDRACRAYQQAVEIEPMVYFHPVITSAGAVCSGEFAQSAAAYTAMLQSPGTIEIESPVAALVLDALDDLQRGDRDEALRNLQLAENALYSDDMENLAWLRFGQAKYADEGFEEVRQMLTVEGIEPDYRTGINIARSQFLREIWPRQFLPQVGYESGDPLLVRLLWEE